VTTVRLNAFGLVTDGSEMSTIASDVTAAWTSLSSSLSGSAGMAGDDELAEDWSPDYDDAAKACAKGTEAIASFLQSFDGLLAGTGAAYKEAELTGAGKPGTSGIEIPTGTTPSAAVPPSALGANPIQGGLGDLAELVEGALYAVGVVFPRGDTGKLRAASGAWSTFAGDLSAAKARLGSTLIELGAADVPQSGVANEVRTAISGLIDDIGEAADGNAVSLGDLADNIEATWAEIRSMLESLAIELAVDIGISVALSFVTFGVGALAGAAKATTTIARWVVKIADVIRKLKLINRIPADKFLKASSVLRKLEHGPMHWRFGAEVVKGTISGGASSVIVSARNGEDITVDSLLATLAGGVVGGVAGGGVGAGFAAAFGRRAGRHAVQPTFFRATATEAAKGAAEGAAGGVAGGATEAGIKGEDFNAGLAALFGMGAGSAMGAGGHGVGAAIDARGGTGLGFDADAALAGRDGENVSPAFLAERQAASDGAVGRDGGASTVPADSPVHEGGPTVPTAEGSPAPSPVAGNTAGGSSGGGGAAAVSTTADAPAASAGAGAGGGTSGSGGAGPVRTDVADIDTTAVSDAAPSGDGVSHAASSESTAPDSTAGSDSGSPESSAPETSADSSVTDSSSTSESPGSTESSAPGTASSDSSTSTSADGSATPDSSTVPDASTTPESTAVSDAAATPEAGTTPESATSEVTVEETPVGEATTSETVPSDAEATSASSVDTDLVTADQLGITTESSGDASAIPSDAQVADVRSAIDADVAAHAEAAAAHASPQGDTVAPTPDSSATPEAAASTTHESTSDVTPVDVTSSARDDATLGEHATSTDTATSDGTEGSASSHGEGVADVPPAAVGAASAAGATLLMTKPTMSGTSGVPIADRARGTAAGGAEGGSSAASDGSLRGGHESGDVSGMLTDGDAGPSGPYSPRYPEAVVESEARAYRHALDAELSRHGLDRRSFRRLVSKPILKLSSHEMTMLIEIRDSLPDLGPGSIVQKIMPRSFIDPATTDIVAYPIQTGAGGFIARFAHMTAASNGRLITPRLIFQKLGLGYQPSNGTAPFDIGEDERFGIRFELDANFSRNDLNDTMQPLRDLQDLSTNEFGARWDSMSLAERRAGIASHESAYVTDSDRFSQAMAPQRGDPFRGNGWAGQRGHYTPEVQVRAGGRKPPLNPGAEIWRYRADGTQDVFAWFDGSSWQLV
jgi:hypothetical protein